MRPPLSRFLLSTLIFLFSADTALAAEKKPVRIGVLALSANSCRSDHFIEGMKELGYQEGKDFVLECRDADGQLSGLNRAAAELVKTKPSVLLAFGQINTAAIHRATSSIPVVMIASGDPVTFGFVRSFAKPGGNMTGFTYYAPELTGKRIELLKAVLPGMKRVAVLGNFEASPDLYAVYERDIRSAAKKLHLHIITYNVNNLQEIHTAFEQIAKDRMQAVYALPNYLFAQNVQEIADLSRINGLPSIHFMMSYAPLGGLISYGPDYDLLHRRTATYVDKILHGAKPGDLPVSQPERLHLILNQAVAKELGLDIPQNLLLRADKVIE